MEEGTKIKAMRGDVIIGPDQVRLFAYNKIDHQDIYMAQPLEMKKSKVGDAVEPFLEIDKDEAQQLIDSLWDCGLRPSEGSGSAGAMLAVQKHLADMQRIVFKNYS